MQASASATPNIATVVAHVLLLHRPRDEKLKQRPTLRLMRRPCVGGGYAVVEISRLNETSLFREVKVSS